MKHNKIKRTSSYRGYNRFGGYRSYSSSDSSGRSLGRAAAMAVAVVAVSGLVMFSCATVIPRLVEASKKSFFAESSLPETESSVVGENTGQSKEETSKPVEENSKKETSKPAEESSKKETSKSESSKQEFSEPNSEKGYDDNGVFIYKNIGYIPFSGSDDSAKKYSDTINNVAAALDESVNVYLMTVPTHSAVAEEAVQKDNTVAEKENIEEIKNGLSDRISFVDVQTALAEKKSEYIYYNTDESWTSLGAYYAYGKYCETAELNALSLDGLEKNKIENFSGNLISKTKSEKNKNGNSELLKNLDTVEYYNFEGIDSILWRTSSSGEEFVPFVNRDVSAENALDVFCYGDVSLLKVYTYKETGRNLCIIRDSFGSAIAPYLTENYDSIYIIDPTNFEGSISEYCESHSVTDVLFVNGVNTANTEEYIKAVSDRL